MMVEWDKARKAHAKRLKQLLKVLNSKASDKSALQSANRLALMFETDHRRVEISFNKISARCNKKAFLHRYKTPVHALSGKYMPTVLGLLEYLDANGLDLDRWILAQAECIKQTFFNLYMCYGEAAFKRYTDWERRQGNKIVKKVDREKQTDSNLEVIRNSVIAGHIAALSWIPQLSKIGAPDVPTALFFLLPNIQGWYALAYLGFRDEVMETGLCDSPHMVKWWNKYKRSKLIRDTCDKALAYAEVKHGRLEWASK